MQRNQIYLCHKIVGDYRAHIKYTQQYSMWNCRIFDHISFIHSLVRPIPNKNTNVKILHYFTGRYFINNCKMHCKPQNFTHNAVEKTLWHFNKNTHKIQKQQ